MKKIFSLEDVLTFMSGRNISHTNWDPMDDKCFLYQICNLVTGHVFSPFDLMMFTGEVRSLIKSKFPEITDWDIGEPAGGWNSINEGLMGAEISLANKQVFVASLYQKFGRTTFELEGPDDVEQPTHAIKMVEF